MADSNMYPDTRTWNPFKGCRFDCTYCVPSFKKQSKRQKHICGDCYTYTPHCHEDRLGRVPSADIVFVCGNGDISFCPPDFTRRIIKRVVEHSERSPGKTYYFQSKRPAYFEQFLDMLPTSAILVTTLETNRDDGYAKIAKAPAPSERYRQFAALDYGRKMVNIEPVLDFDPDIFIRWITSLAPEYVYLGFNNWPGSVTLPEPSREKARDLILALREAGIDARDK